MNLLGFCGWGSFTRVSDFRVFFGKLTIDLGTIFGFYSGDCFDRAMVLPNFRTCVCECEKFWPLYMVLRACVRACVRVCVCLHKCILCLCVYVSVRIHVCGNTFVYFLLFLCFFSFSQKAYDNWLVWFGFIVQFIVYGLLMTFVGH